MDTRALQQLLRDIAWPITVDGDHGPQTQAAVKAFQRGWAFYELLDYGWVGPQTEKALHDCAQGDGRCSIYFRYREFKSKGDGWCKVDRHLVAGLDRYRERYGPTVIESGYRDPAHNRKVGGASNSIHLYGGAADLRPVAGFNAVRNLRVFSGIGIIRDSGLVRHVDVRGQGWVPNTTGGRPDNPTVWYYG